MGILQSATSVDPFLFAPKCAFYDPASIILPNGFYSKSPCASPLGVGAPTRLKWQQNAGLNCSAERSTELTPRAHSEAPALRERSPCGATNHQPEGLSLSPTALASGFPLGSSLVAMTNLW